MTLIVIVVALVRVWAVQLLAAVLSKHLKWIAFCIFVLFNFFSSAEWFFDQNGFCSCLQISPVGSSFGILMVRRQVDFGVLNCMTF